MSAANAMALRWASIAPLPEEREPVVEVEPAGESALNTEQPKAA